MSVFSNLLGDTSQDAKHHERRQRLAGGGCARNNYNTFSGDETDESVTSTASLLSSLRSHSPRIQRLSFKIVVLGDTNVGKTSLVQRFADDTFPVRHEATIGVAFMSRTIFQAAEIMCTLNIWDLAGQDRFIATNRPFYRETAGAIIVYDCTKARTLDRVRMWKRHLDEEHADVPCVLAANKYDLVEPHTRRQLLDYENRPPRHFDETSARRNSDAAIQRARGEEDGTDDNDTQTLDGQRLHELTSELDIAQWFACSAKSGYNVDTLFRTLCELCLRRYATDCPDRELRDKYGASGSFVDLRRYHPQKEKQKSSWCAC